MARHPPAAWTPGPAQPCLRSADVHVWQANLAAFANHRARCTELLSPEELGRAARFHSEALKDRFLVAHGLLRILASRYCHAAPEALGFAANAFGKPRLISPPAAALQLNLSASGDLALFAFATADVGVDVEILRPIPEAEAIAERCFSPRERAAWSALAEPERTRAFFQIWTCKEAVTKATGRGLNEDLSEIEIGLSAEPVWPPASIRGLRAGEGAPLSLNVLSPSLACTGGEGARAEREGGVQFPGTTHSVSPKNLAHAVEAVGAVAVRESNPALSCWALNSLHP